MTAALSKATTSAPATTVPIATERFWVVPRSAPTSPAGYLPSFLARAGDLDLLKLGVAMAAMIAVRKGVAPQVHIAFVSIHMPPGARTSNPCGPRSRHCHETEFHHDKNELLDL
jgi:hypothetical protein